MKYCTLSRNWNNKKNSSIEGIHTTINHNEYIDFTLETQTRNWLWMVAHFFFAIEGDYIATRGSLDH